MISFNGQNTPSDEDGTTGGWEASGETANGCPQGERSGDDRINCSLLEAPLQGALAALTWDARNHLTSAGGLSYTYDSENRRTSRTSGSTTTTYVHDPNSRLSRLLTATTGTETTRFVYAGDRLLYQENPNGEISVFHFDTRGSTVAISDAVGTVTDRMSYGPYGEVISTTGTTATPFRYHGALGVQTDPNGLCQMRARYYSTEIRRFLNADPIGFEGGANWFAFVGGDPVNFVDPEGDERKKTLLNLLAAVLMQFSPTDGDSTKPVLDMTRSNPISQMAEERRRRKDIEVLRLANKLAKKTGRKLPTVAITLAITTLVERGASEMIDEIVSDVNFVRDFEEAGKLLSGDLPGFPDDNLDGVLDAFDPSSLQYWSDKEVWERISGGEEWSK